MLYYKKIAFDGSHHTNSYVINECNEQLHKPTLITWYFKHN